jgi:hypothetical protein
MYYRTEIDQLISCLSQLVDTSSSFFIHAHLFRRHGQEQELIDAFYARLQWVTHELPVEVFISAEELSHHPEWYRVRSLLSAREEVVQQIISSVAQKRGVDPKAWLVFQPEPPQATTTTTAADNSESELGILFNS